MDIKPYVSPRRYPSSEKNISQAESLALLRQYRDTGDAEHINAILLGNMKTIIALCREFKMDHVEDMHDLMQEASIGFLKGVKKWDEGSGASISSYARFWAEKEVRIYFMQFAHNVRVPENCHRAYRKMMHTHSSAMHEHETDNIAPDALIEGDKYPYDIAGATVAGALTLFYRGHSDPAAEPTEEGWTHRADLQRILQKVKDLPDAHRRMVEVSFGFKDRRSMPKGYKPKEIEAVVRNAVTSIQRELGCPTQ